MAYDQIEEYAVPIVSLEKPKQPKSKKQERPETQFDWFRVRNGKVVLDKKLIPEATCDVINAAQANLETVRHANESLRDASYHYYQQNKALAKLLEEEISRNDALTEALEYNRLTRQWAKELLEASLSLEEIDVLKRRLIALSVEHDELEADSTQYMILLQNVRALFTAIRESELLYKVINAVDGPLEDWVRNFDKENRKRRTTILNSAVAKLTPEERLVLNVGKREDIPDAEDLGECKKKEVEEDDEDDEDDED